MYKPGLSLNPVFYIPGIIYRAGVHIRNRAFDGGFMSVRRLSQPTVSVGNLTMGGTGKTPFVIFLSSLFKELGFVTAVLTRGYGRRRQGKTIVLPPGENPRFAVSRLGDEPALIRRRIPLAWLGISSDRFNAATAITRRLEHSNQTDRLVFILDDGFQHRGIRRDLDIVMIDPAWPPYADRLFPMGALREPVSGLSRAHIVVINGINKPSNAEEAGNARFEDIVENLRKYAPEADYFQCVQRIRAIIPFPDWLKNMTPYHLSSPPKTAFLAAAIGNPGRFKQDIQGMEIETRGSAFFRDHAVIDWKNCVKSAQKAGAEAVIITEKDAVKISNPPEFPLFVAVQDTELPEAARFREILLRYIKKYGGEDVI